MAVYKCKMCGASLDVDEKHTVVTCDYCGASQTIFSFDNEKKVNLFKRANLFRLRCEFDKASGVFESIIAEFPKEAEAYWGLILCKYGIEYIDDPGTGKKIPTCHRTETSSIFDDVDYKNVIKNCDAVARNIYEKEASEIFRLQNGILEASKKIEPYDVFICYKELDEDGNRTEDSVLAEEIYSALASKKYRVFFSRITLENKLGAEYEPLIYSALHSSKIMIHVTTSNDHSDSVWVKNEWSRYLSLIKEGGDKTLIPCFKNMSAFELPKEMEKLQGQDFSKLGAIQDLVRGVEKIIGVADDKNDSTAEDEKEIYDKYLKKGRIYLTRGLFDDAIECFKNATKIIDKNGQAFLGMLLAENKMRTLEAFCSSCISASLTENPNYINAKRGRDDISGKQIDLIESKLNDMQTRNALRITLSLIANGDWKEAEEVSKKNKLTDEFLADINDAKYRYLLEKTRNFIQSKDAAHFLEFEDCSQLVSLCSTFLDYKDVSMIKESLDKFIQDVVRKNENERKENLSINIPSQANVEDLIEVALKISRVSTISANNVYFIEDELKKEYAQKKEEALSWLTSNTIAFINNGASYGDRVFINLIVSCIDDKASAGKIEKTWDGVKYRLLAQRNKESEMLRYK